MSRRRRDAPLFSLLLLLASLAAAPVPAAGGGSFEVRPDRAPPAPPAGARTMRLDREHDPVVIAGAKLAALPTRRSGRLALRRVVGGVVEPVRFQVDARDRDGDLVVDAPADVVVDDDDELVFMAKDAGERADPGVLPACDGVLEIELTDPRDGARGWVYLLAFRDPPATPALPPYVTFDLAGGRAESELYRVAYAPERNFFTGIEVLAAAGGSGSNLLHQTRMRGSPTFSLLFADLTLDFTEQSSIVVIEGVRSGPVRAVRRVRLSVDLGPLFPELPNGTAYTYHYRSAYLTPTRVDFPWILLETLRDFRFENVFDFHPSALPLRYFDAWYRDGIVLAEGEPLELHTHEDRAWWAHESAAGTVLHAFVIPEQWRRWGVVRGTVVRAGADGRAAEDGSEEGRAGEERGRYAAGYTLLHMTRLREAGSYDMLMASVVLPEGYAPGAEAGPLAMLNEPLAVAVRRVR